MCIGSSFYAERNQRRVRWESTWVKQLKILHDKMLRLFFCTKKKLLQLYIKSNFFQQTQNCAKLFFGARHLEKGLNRGQGNFWCPFFFQKIALFCQYWHCRNFLDQALSGHYFLSLPIFIYLFLFFLLFKQKMLFLFFIGIFFTLQIKHRQKMSLQLHITITI